MSNNIKLKDLVWKETNKEEEIDKLLTKYSNIWAETDTDESRAGFIFNNAEQIAKEKAEILNKQIEYTKEDIIDMFVEAGLRKHKTIATLIYTVNKYCLHIILNENYFDMELGDEESSSSIEKTEIYYNDRKTIEFYYNIFRNILEFEVRND